MEFGSLDIWTGHVVWTYFHSLTEVHIRQRNALCSGVLGETEGPRCHLMVGQCLISNSLYELPVGYNNEDPNRLAHARVHG